MIGSSTRPAQRVAPPHMMSLWLALAVALLSSLMPIGLPRTTALGSAFNPATTAVALQPSRTLPRALIEHVRRDDQPAGDRHLLAQASSVPTRVGPQPAVAAPAMPSGTMLPLSPLPGLAGNPRGPPSA